MTLFKHVLVLSVFLCLGYAAKKFPSYVEKCHINDPEINKCFLKAVEVLRPHLREGVPELQIPAMDPLVLPEAGIDNGEDFHGTFKNIQIFYAHTFVVRDLNVNLSRNHIDLSVTFPKLRIKSNYHIHGKMLVFQLDGEGPCDGNFTNVEANLVIDGTRYMKGKKEYMRLDNKTLDLNLGKPVFQFDNIFKDNEELNTQTNRALNENIVNILEELRPVIDQTVVEFIIALVGRIFVRFSMNELFLS